MSKQPLPAPTASAVGPWYNFVKLFADTSSKEACHNAATPQIPEIKTDKLASSIVPDEVAQNETPHLDLHCLPSKASEFSMI